jgi:integrase/recombinase XerC
MIDSFLKYLEFEKRCSPHTLQSYKYDLNTFQSFLLDESPGISLEEALVADVRAWLYSLTESGLSARSINRKIASLRSFFKFVRRVDPGFTNPMENIRPMKTRQRLPEFVTEGEIVRLLENHDFEDSFAGYRDRLILELLYGTGIRLSEMLGLTCTDISFTPGQIRVLGKRNKERIIPLPKGIIPLVTRYLEIRENVRTSGSGDYLLITDNGNPVYPMFIYRRVKHYLSLFTTANKNSPHVLRHTFATHLLNKGADLNAVKDLLGHANLAATQVYTHNSIEKLKSVYDKAHPKA